MNLLLVDGLILYTTAIHTVFLAMIRYREPLMPFLLVFAAMGIMCAVEALRRHSGRKDVSEKCPPGTGAPA